jgi:hypothetical protein
MNPRPRLESTFRRRFYSVGSQTMSLPAFDQKRGGESKAIPIPRRIFCTLARFDCEITLRGLIKCWRDVAR